MKINNNARKSSASDMEINNNARKSSASEIQNIPNHQSG